MRMLTSRRASGGGVGLTEYVLVVSLLSAMVWAVFANLGIYGWGEAFDFPEEAGRGRATLSGSLAVAPLVTGDPVSWENVGGTFLVRNPSSNTRIMARYMGANAGLASRSSLWMRVRSLDGTVTDVRLTATNTGAARDVVIDHPLKPGDEVSFYERIVPGTWSKSALKNFQEARGRLDAEGGYNVFSSASSGPDNVTTVTHYPSDGAGNIFGHDEYHIGFEDLPLDYGGCDRDYNDAELRVAIFDVEEP